MGNVWNRNGRTLREIAKDSVAGEPYTDEGDRRVADGWGGSAGRGLRTQIGVSGNGLCPGRRSGRWSITVLDERTGECGVWDLRELRRELAAEARGIVQQALF
jgi:hypothetical protein